MQMFMPPQRFIVILFTYQLLALMVARFSLNDWRKIMVQQIMKKSSATTPNYLIYSRMMAEDFALSRVTNAISHANTIVLGSILNNCEPGHKHL